MLAGPAWGRKPPNESSAYTRASIAWPVTADVVLAERQRLARGDAELELAPGRVPVTSSVTGCSTWSRVFISRKYASSVSASSRNSTVPALT